MTNSNGGLTPDKIKIYVIIFKMIIMSVLVITFLGLAIWTLWNLFNEPNDSAKWKYVIIEGFNIGTLFVVVTYFFNSKKSL